MIPIYESYWTNDLRKVAFTKWSRTYKWMNGQTDKSGWTIGHTKKLLYVGHTNLSTPDCRKIALWVIVITLCLLLSVTNYTFIIIRWSRKNFSFVMSVRNPRWPTGKSGKHRTLFCPCWNWDQHQHNNF
jgi:hypothetical protein